MITMSVNDVIVWRRELYSYTINGQLIYFIKCIYAETFMSIKSTNMLYE